MSLLVEVLYAIKHFCMHLVHSFGKRKQDTCWVTSIFLGARTTAGNKGATEPSSQGDEIWLQYTKINQ